MSLSLSRSHHTPTNDFPISISFSVVLETVRKISRAPIPYSNLNSFSQDDISSGLSLGSGVFTILCLNAKRPWPGFT